MAITPTNGRDYKSKKAVQEAFYNGENFIVNDVTDPFCGKYCSVRDFKNGEQVTIRYNKQRSCMVLTVEKK